jgi:uncharacterized protein
MRIKVSEIPQEGLDVREEMSLEWDDLQARASFEARAEKVGQEVLLKGVLEASVELACSRCLGRFRQDLRVPVDVFYHPAETLKEETRELGTEEMSTGFYQEDEIDTAVLAREQLMLNLPMKPLCRADCKGICPRCGANLNIQSCQCPVKGGSALQGALEKFLKERKQNG